MGWRDQFPDFDNGESCEALLSAGWTDVSWGNEPCPSFIKGDSTIFVDYVDPQRCEFPETKTYSLHNEHRPDHAPGFDTLAEALAANEDF